MSAALSHVALTWRMTHRSVRVISLLLFGVVAAAVVLVDRDRLLRRERIHQWWQRRLVHTLGLRLRVHGAPLLEPRLTVSNHVSWLDIPVLAASEPMRFVSKSEVAHWPIAGYLATGAGTFYIRRGAGGTRQLVESMARHLGAGSIAFYPEGTTTEGDRLLRFQPRLFAAAIEAGCKIQPVAVRYGPSRTGENIAPFVGDDALSSHLLRMMREPFLTVELHYLRPFDPRGMDRAAVAQLAHELISTVVAPQQNVPARTERRGARSLAA